VAAVWDAVAELAELLGNSSPASPLVLSEDTQGATVEGIQFSIRGLDDRIVRCEQDIGGLQKTRSSSLGESSASQPLQQRGQRS
ncbi:unnamed protein product, partial [Polarella glacialis]